MRKLLIILSLIFLQQNTWGKDLFDIAIVPNHTLDDVYAHFREFENFYEDHHDRRKLFVKVYRRITSNIENLLRKGEIYEGPWLEKIVIQFAEEYRKAVLSYQIMDFYNLPQPWLFDFDQARRKDIGLATQLLLSLNSHILHDLPLVIAESVHDSYRIDIFKRDYFYLNEMFTELTPELFNMLYREAGYEPASYYHPAEMMKRQIVDSIVLAMRELAWKRSKKLASLRTKEAKKAYMKEIAEHTVYMGTVVLELDPFLSSKPGQLLPDHVIDSSWKAIKKIHEALETKAPPIDFKMMF